MNNPKTLRWTHGLIASLPIQIAVAGIPVLDGVNTSQTAISAIQNRRSSDKVDRTVQDPAPAVSKHA